MYEADDIKAVPDVGPLVSVMTWNIKFAGGRLQFFLIVVALKV